jgi:predicted amidophosphoribosyltransferase
VADASPLRCDSSATRRRVPAWLAAAGDALVSIFFPAGCRICDRLLVTASRVPVCEKCLASFETIPDKSCKTCGAPLVALSFQEERPELCPACQEKTFAFERARSFGVYEGALVRAILLLKFEQIEPLAAWFAARLAELVASEPAMLAADVLVPVPLHRARQRERGYNQAALLSKALARGLCLPHQAILLTAPGRDPTNRC